MLLAEPLERSAIALSVAVADARLPRNALLYASNYYRQTMFAVHWTAPPCPLEEGEPDGPPIVGPIVTWIIGCGLGQSRDQVFRLRQMLYDGGAPSRIVLEERRGRRGSARTDTDRAQAVDTRGERQEHYFGDVGMSGSDGRLVTLIQADQARA